MVARSRDSRPKTADSEKITINLGYVDLGQVDLLVHEGQSEEARLVLVRALKQNGRPGLAKVMEQVAVYHATPADAPRPRRTGQKHK